MNRKYENHFVSFFTFFTLWSNTFLIHHERRSIHTFRHSRIRDRHFQLHWLFHFILNAVIACRIVLYLRYSLLNIRQSVNNMYLKCEHSCYRSICNNWLKIETLTSTVNKFMMNKIIATVVLSVQWIRSKSFMQIMRRTNNNIKGSTNQNKWLAKF